MAQNKRKAVGEQVMVSPVVPLFDPIEDLAQLRKDLRNAVVGAIGDKSVGFSEPRQIPGNRVLISLTGSSARDARAKYDYNVVPFLYAATFTYWIAVAVEIEFRRGAGYPVEASILVFQGDPNDPEKTPLLRAEWVHSDRPSDEKHAQPHWHVYSGSVNEGRGAVIGSDFDRELTEESIFAAESGESTALAVPIWRGGEFFHFAMSSTWHEQADEKIYVQITAERLIRWVHGCIAYIRAQIQYVQDCLPAE